MKVSVGWLSCTLLSTAAFELFYLLCQQTLDLEILGPA